MKYVDNILGWIMGKWVMFVITYLCQSIDNKNKARIFIELVEEILCQSCGSLWTRKGKPYYKEKRIDKYEAIVKLFGVFVQFFLNLGPFQVQKSQGDNTKGNKEAA